MLLTGALLVILVLLALYIKDLRWQRGLYESSFRNELKISDRLREENTQLNALVLERAMDLGDAQAELEKKIKVLTTAPYLTVYRLSHPTFFAESEPPLPNHILDAIGLKPGQTICLRLVALKSDNEIFLMGGEQINENKN